MADLRSFPSILWFLVNGVLFAKLILPFARNYIEKGEAFSFRRKRLNFLRGSNHSATGWELRKNDVLTECGLDSCLGEHCFPIASQTLGSSK